MRSDEYDECEQYVIARTLHLLKALPMVELFSIASRGIEKDSEFLSYWLLLDSYRIFDYNDARRIIEVALRKRDYYTRVSAYNAAVGLQYIAGHGGSYTDDIGSELWKKQMAAATAGAPPPMYYEQLQYYVGGAVYDEARLLEQRLSELWDPSKRKMPLFTEQS